MLTIERREKLKEIIISKKTVTVAEMARKFSVSKETIRRDFEVLDGEGFLIKSYGGATLVPKKNVLVSQRIKSEIMVEEKKRMTKAAAELIRPNDCIFLDHSTTVFTMCEYLLRMPLVVMTNSLPVMQFFSEAENIHLCATGGDFHIPAQAFLGGAAVAYMRGYSLDKAFISCSCVDPVQGATDSTALVAELHREIIACSDTVCLFADRTKLNRTSFVKTCTLDKIDYLVSDIKLSEEFKSSLEIAGVCLKECP